jgi:hypothetical protein
MVEFKLKTFGEIEHLFPTDSWIVWRNNIHDREFESKTILLIEGDYNSGKLNLNGSLDSFDTSAIDGYTNSNELIFAILIKGNLFVNDIFNEDTDGGTGLVVLGNIEADIVVGGQEIYITGNLLVRQLFWGDYNHGNLRIAGTLDAKIFIDTGDYAVPDFVCNKGPKSHIEYHFSDEIETADNDYNSNTLKIFLISELVSGEEELTEEAIGWGGYLKRETIISYLLNNKQLLLQ